MPWGWGKDARNIFQRRRTHATVKWSLFLSLFCGLFLLFSALACASEPAVQVVGKNCSIQLKQIQMAKATQQGDSFPVPKNWQTLDTLPDRWDKRWPNYSGSVWYQLKWHYACKESQKSSLLLVMSYMSMAGQVYFNNDALWQSQSLVEPLSRGWNTPRRWVLPSNVLKPGENTLLIRVVGVSNHAPGLGQVHIDEYDRAMQRYDQYWLEMRGLNIYSLCFEIVLMVIAGFIWLFRREEKAFGWYALNSLMWILYRAFNLITEPLLGMSTLTLDRYGHFVFVVFAVLSCIYTWRFADTYLPKVERVLWAVMVCFAVMLFLLPDDVIPEVLMLAVVCGSLIYIGNCVFYPYLAYRSKRVEAYLLVVIMTCIYLPFALHDAVVTLKNTGVFLSPYASLFSTVILACIFALRLTQSLRKVENFSHTLEQKVLQVRSELRESMSLAHDLELQNAKLEQRIQLAHDLHDGLGGNLIRSIASVEHSREKISHMQVLSMLKSLRDDLRQIVDHGSSYGTTIPDTPIVWIAPLRYRFNRLFDELGIDATWDIPSTWQVPIDIADCMTLQRVVEEALVNIVKHSSASEVSVCLSFHHLHILQLDIEDNGVGFDIAMIQGAGLSVGLRSMRNRVECIHAQLNIESKGGRTVISLIKHYAVQKQ